MCKRLTIESAFELAQKNNGKFLSDKFIGVKYKYLWECKNKHRFYKKYFKVQRGGWCPQCYKEDRIITKEKCILFAQKNNGKFLSTEEILSSKQKLKWLCAKEHEFFMIYNNIQQGQWCPVCAEQKRIETRLKKYGVRYPLQNKDIRLKQARSANKIVEVTHWLSGKTISCQGSYELKTVIYFNKNRINFMQEPKTFSIEDGRTYTPDYYLPDQDLWIEVKGYFWEDAQEKWQWFHQNYPNSELWNEQKLKELKIL